MNTEKKIVVSATDKKAMEFFDKMDKMKAELIRKFKPTNFAAKKAIDNKQN